jgi:hypothetical protein
MKLNLVKNTLVVAVLATLILGCRTNKDEKYLGPKVVIAPKGFQVIGDSLLAKPTVAVKGIDYQNGSPAYFKSDFSNEASWKLVITSKNNGAYKVLNGTSKSLDAAVATWNGGSDYLLFSSGDSCDAKLSFTGYVDGNNEPIVKTTKFKVNKGLIYDGLTFNNVKSHVVADFDNSVLTTPYFDVSAGTNFVSKNEYRTEKAQGNFALYCTGKDPNNNGYIGGYDMPNLVGLTGKVTSTNPDDVYINMYVRGFGKTNTGLTLLVYELDSLTKFGKPVKIDESEFAGLTKTCDKWIKQINVDWVGWKLVSIKYSSFIKPNSDACNGNCTQEPHKLRGLSIGLDSYPNTGFEAELAVDMIVITENGPFKPY